MIYNEEAAKLQEEQESYKDETEIYLEDLTELEVKQAADSVIDDFKDDFGWTFIAKVDRKTYLKTIVGTWVV